VAALLWGRFLGLSGCPNSRANFCEPPNHRQTMSALGHERTLPPVCAMSALPPIADINRGNRYVRFVPIADIRKTDGAKQKDRLTAALPKSHRVF
jgi:hypothetical protein